jgi:hypothetical protein
MGTADLRSAMEAAGLRIADVTMRHDAGRQIISASGWHPDGKPFAQTSEPFTGDPIVQAAKMARDIIARRKLTADIANGADRIASATVIATALVEGKARMALAEKSKRLADRAHAVPKVLEARIDAALVRLDAVEKAGGAAMDGLEAHIGDSEAAIAATEDVVRQISNSPLGEGSAKS